MTPAVKLPRRSVRRKWALRVAVGYSAIHKEERVAHDLVGAIGGLGPFCRADKTLPPFAPSHRPEHAQRGSARVRAQTRTPALSTGLLRLRLPRSCGRNRRLGALFYRADKTNTPEIARKP